MLGIIYAVMKLLFPTKNNRILFISRQSDEMSLDFLMLKEEIEKQDSKAEIIAICNRFSDDKGGIIGLGMASLKSMYYLATSKVCVLDAYWPIVSILSHKKELKIIQMWHAIGKIKKSGYQTLGKESGRGEAISKALCMHRNYDYVIAGGTAWNPYYCQSFDISENKLVNIGLPRIDYILDTEEKNRQKVYSKYPMFKEKKVILYAPTFRRNMELNWQDLLDAINFEQYHLIIKGHPNQKIECEKSGVYECPEFSAVDLLSVCDYLITDYSAIAVEAAVLNKKTYYYLFDYDEYMDKNGINVSPFESMPGCAFRDAKELIEDLESGNYKQKVLDLYREKYLPENLGKSTEKLAQLVINLCGMDGGK